MDLTEGSIEFLALFDFFVDVAREWWRVRLLLLLVDSLDFTQIDQILLLWEKFQQRSLPHNLNFLSIEVRDFLCETFSLII